MITSVSESQGEILANILRLHARAERFDLDPCYGHGTFYSSEIPEPRLKFDIQPRYLDVRLEDVRNMKLPSATISSVIFDPPFMHAPGKDSVMGERFGGYPTQHALRAMYLAALVEIYRVLKPRGILVVKTQDTVESGKFVANSVKMVNMATDLGFEQIDTFVLVRKQAMVGHNHGEQAHCRKVHSYFIVFRKTSRT